LFLVLAIFHVIFLFFLIHAICTRSRVQANEPAPYQGVVYQSGVGPQAQFDAPISEATVASSSAATTGANPFGGYQSSA
jgi:hypothetical protein